MTLVLRPILDFSQPDYSVIWKTPDGTERDVGRVYYSPCVSSDPTTCWRWSVYGQPHDGLAATLDDANAAFRLCWDSVGERA
jgi:hypothetical protein